MLDLAFDSERIKALRQRLGLSQRAMAERLGVAQPTVANWETGKKEPQGQGVLSRLYQLEREA